MRKCDGCGFAVDGDCPICQSARDEFFDQVCKDWPSRSKPCEERAPLWFVVLVSFCFGVIIAMLVIGALAK